MRYRANVLVALEVTPPAMAAFADELEAEGWRVGRFHVDDPDPATLLRLSLDGVTTTIALRLDADTRPGEDLDLAVAAVLASGADLCSVKCEVENTTNLVTRMQHVEYRMAMLGRHIRPWLTSGACFIGRTAALKELYKQHSLWDAGRGHRDRHRGEGAAHEGAPLRLRRDDGRSRTRGRACSASAACGGRATSADPGASTSTRTSCTGR